MSLKKKVTQGDLRKAMNEAKKKIATVKKIESPLAKYTEAGQLMCILCKTTVRGEATWPVHLNSRSHRENIESAKKSIVGRDGTERIAAGSTTKRPVSPSRESAPSKKVKGILTNSSIGKVRTSSASNFADGADSNEGGTRSTEKSAIVRADKARQGGAAGQERDDCGAAALPEGFFDDPKLDAKVRNVDYKDPIEEEWDKFRREIKEEAAQSAQIIADDQEEATTVRQLDEIEEQMRNWTRVMDFVKLKDQVRTSEKKMDNTGEAESSDDDEDYDEFLDWRAKNSYR